MPRHPTIYTGPSTPTEYDPLWGVYTNLTPDQIAWFESQPADLIRYIGQRRWQAEISGTTIAGVPLTTQFVDQQKIAGLKQAFDNGTITGTVPFSDAQGTTQVVNAAVATAIYVGVVDFVQQTYQTAATLKAGAGKTITSRAQVDAAFAAIAPNSASAQMVKAQG